MSMILLEPANKITHCNVEIKRRTISLTGFSETSTELAENNFRIAGYTTSCSGQEDATISAAQ
jgi:hypothetical protein